MADPLISKVINYRQHVGDILVPAHHTAPKVGVPVKAKELATKYLDASSRERRARVQEIYEEGLAIETGVVIRLRDRGSFEEYMNFMYEEDQYHTTKKLKQEGDGGIALT
jgi:hypothetical protein